MGLNPDLTGIRTQVTMQMQERACYLLDNGDAFEYYVNTEEETKVKTDGDES